MMALRIVCNRKVDMSNDEYAMFEKIRDSYTNATNNGEDYFDELFETDESGIIVFLRPPSKKFTSLEIFLFLVALQSQQHLRRMQEQLDTALLELKATK